MYVQNQFLCMFKINFIGRSTLSAKIKPQQHNFVFPSVTSPFILGPRPNTHKHRDQSSHNSMSQVGLIAKKPGPVVIKLFSCSTHLSTKFILLIKVKMPTIVGILTFISMINTTYERLKARHFFICRYFSFYEQFKSRAQLSQA